MKVEAHIRLEKKLLDEVDSLSGGENHRSELVEEALHAYLSNIPRVNADERDVEIINQHAKELSDEAFDVLDYQVAL